MHTFVIIWILTFWVYVYDDITTLVHLEWSLKLRIKITLFHSVVNYLSHQIRENKPLHGVRVNQSVAFPFNVNNNFAFHVHVINDV